MQWARSAYLEMLSEATHRGDSTFVTQSFLGYIVKLRSATISQQRTVRTPFVLFPLLASQ